MVLAFRNFVLKEDYNRETSRLKIVFRFFLPEKSGVLKIVNGRNGLTFIYFQSLKRGFNEGN